MNDGQIPGNDPQTTQEVIRTVPPHVQVVPETSKTNRLLNTVLIVIAASLISLLIYGAWNYHRSTTASTSTQLAQSSNIKPITTSSSSTISTDQTVSSAVPDAINPVDPKNVSLGNNKNSSAPKSGYIYSCTLMSGGGGAQTVGPWVNETTSTWDVSKKVAVSGAVKWANAAFRVDILGDKRIITGNDLPIDGQTTGIFPVQSSDQAYNYDRNPNSIASQVISLSMPVNPVAAKTPSCSNGGGIGILTDGVVLFNAFDGEGRDAAAYETLDLCQGHPERTSEYHHHNITNCIADKYKKPSTSNLVGYANDGYGIYIERDKNGVMLTNSNLDECHGRTSVIDWDGKQVNMYHYVASIEFPYTVGCFHGTPLVSTSQSNQPPNGPGSATQKLGTPPPH
jgi:hypothetical protein